MIDERVKKGGRQRVGLPEEGMGNFLDGLLHERGLFPGMDLIGQRKKRKKKDPCK